MPASRLVFLGSGEFGLPTLQRLAAVHEVAAVITQPDRPAGRKRRLTPTPVAAWARVAGLKVLEAEDVNAAATVAHLRGLNADAAVVVAFGQKLSPDLVAALGPFVVNLHGSLLPRYRGAAPINWAVIRGEAETGLTVISLAQRMDAGLIYGQAATSVDPLATAGELHDRLAAMGPKLVADVLDRWQAGTLEGRPQDETLATRAPKLSRADSWVDLTRDARTVQARVHGLTPWPGVKVLWRQRNGREQPLALHRVEAEPDSAHDAVPGTLLSDERVAVGSGAVRLLEVQPPGRRVMSIAAFVSGHAMQPGDQLISGSTEPPAGDPDH